MKLKLACADFTFPLLPHGQVLDLIAMLGFSGVDIGLFEKRGHLQPSSELKNIASAAKKLKRKLESRGLALADMFLIPGTSFAELAPNHPEASVRRQAREQFQRVVEYTLLAGGRHVGALPGIAWKGESRADSLQRSSEELAWRAAYAQQHGVVYSVEPHIDSIVARPGQVEELIKATPGLTLTLDYAHFTSAGIPDSEIEPLIGHTSHFHCRGGAGKRLQASYSENTIDYGRVLRRMRATGYRGYITLEYVWSEWQDCNRTDNLSETILFRDFLIRSTGN